MSHYTHLSLEEREKLFALKAQGKSLRSIATVLQRSDATLSRELRRNITGVGKSTHELFNAQYLPCKAQIKSDRRLCKQRSTAPLKNTRILSFVLKHLREDGWSPETIAGKLGHQYPGESITKETIYRYIYSNRFKPRGIFASKQKPLYQYLSLTRKKRMKLGGRKVARSGKIPGSISIDKRPKYIQKRVQIGHWETDNVIGKSTDKTALSVTIERVSRYVIITKLQNRSARYKKDAVVGRLLMFPEEIRRTITTDNGKENYYHTQIANELSLKMYFAHPYSSWEKGSVENMNGRIRRFIPKGVSIDQISEEYIKRLEDKLNNTPRKCLNFLTPQERMNILLKAT